MIAVASLSFSDSSSEIGTRVCSRSEHREPWLIVCGGFHRHGGMDRANLALAEYLRRSGSEVCLVGHDFDSVIAPEMIQIRVPRVLGSTALGEAALRLAGKRQARTMVGSNPATRVLVNGGNCSSGDINWVHYVHHEWAPSYVEAPLWFRLRHRFQRSIYCRREAEALRRARVVIANSKSCAQQVISIGGVLPDRVRVVYPGCSRDSKPASAQEKAAARQWLKVRADQRVVVFVGAITWDEHKGFDTLWRSWKMMTDPANVLVVAGTGGKLKHWQDQVKKTGMLDNVRMLGFTQRVDELLAAADLLVSPSRYDTFGLNVQEAICRGVPAVVSSRAGISELFPASMRELILEDPNCAEELAALLKKTLCDLDTWRARTLEFREKLRTYSWDDMSRRIVELAGANA